MKRQDVSSIVAVSVLVFAGAANSHQPAGAARSPSGLRQSANYFAARTRPIGGDVVPNQSQDQVPSRMIGKWNYQAKTAAEEGQVWEFTSEPYSGTVLPAQLAAETLPAKVFVAKLYQADGTLKREAGYGLATDSKTKDTQAKILKARRAGKDCYLLYITYAQKKDSGTEFKNDWRPIVLETDVIRPLIGEDWKLERIK